VRGYELAGNRRLHAISLCYSGYIHHLLGHASEGLATTTRALALLRQDPPIVTALADGLGFLAKILLAQGQIEAAVAAASEAAGIVTKLGGIGGSEGAILLVHAEALHAVGDGAGARTALAEARRWILAAVERMADPEIRADYLGKVDAHARILALAKEWLGS
jgi:hypothetical protein